MRYYAYDSDGNIVGRGECPQGDIPQSTPGRTVVIGEADPWAQYYDTGMGVLRDFTPEQAAARRADPGPGYRWSRDRWIDERTLPDAKLRRWQIIKSERAAAEAGTFSVGAYLFDADRASQTRILAAMQAAIDARTSGEPFSLEWTLADGTDVTLTRAQVIAVGRRLQEHMNAQHTRARVCKAAIAAAQTLAEVDAVQW
jgi:hypothetical protein